MKNLLFGVVGKTRNRVCKKLRFFGNSEARRLRDGAGKRAKVTSVSIVDKDWGHYRWERYWHTVALTADFDGWGSRMLTFDSYEVRP